MLCPVCKHNCGEESVCANCGFDQFRFEFVSREDAENWLQNIVIPYREEFNLRASVSSVDWVGKLYQNKEVQYFLNITVPAALKQNTTIGHTLLICPNNRLVFTFVSVLGSLVEPRAVLCASRNEQQVEAPLSVEDIVRSSLIEAHEGISAMAARITNLSENSIFLQAGTMLPTQKDSQDALSLVLSDFYFVIQIGKGPAAKKIRLDTAPFTLLAFAEKERDIPKQYLSYFENIIHFEQSASEICEMEIIATITEKGHTITHNAATKIASHVNNNMRKAVVLCRRICDYMLVKEPDNKRISDAVVDTVLSQLM